MNFLRLPTRLRFFLASLFSLYISSCTKCQKEQEKSLSHVGKKILSVARSADPRTLDPQAQFDQGSSTFISNVYDTLLDYHYLKRPYELMPSLLESMPEVSKDGLTYIFTLKKKIFFTIPMKTNGKQNLILKIIKQKIFLKKL